MSTFLHPVQGVAGSWGVILSQNNNKKNSADKTTIQLPGLHCPITTDTFNRSKISYGQHWTKGWFYI